MAEISCTNRFRRIPILLTFLVAIAASLLVFPNALLWMVAAWLVVGTWSALRGANRWLPFAACAAVLVIKRPDWSPTMTLLGAVTLAAAILFYWLDRIGTADSKQRATWALVVVWLAWLAAVWQSLEARHVRHTPVFNPIRPIVCVGDSLTSGMSANEAYPEHLQRFVSLPVVNFGRPGVTAREMTQRLPEILEYQPQLVVIELGGHDFLRGYGRAATRASLSKIIEACQHAGADVVLAEIPRGFISDPFSGLERELVREYDLELIPDSAIRMLVVRSSAIPIVGALAKPHWSDDSLHPNEAGARMLAGVVHRALERMYGPAISAAPPETLPAGSR